MKIKDYLRIPRSFRISLIDAFSNNSKINRIFIASRNDYAILKNRIFKKISGTNQNLKNHDEKFEN